MKIKKMLLIPALVAALAGCGVAEWVKAAQQILPVVLPMVTNLVAAVSLLQGKTVSGADLNIITQTANQVSSDLNLAAQLVNQYQSSPSPNTLNSINNALFDVNSHLNALMPALHINDPATVQKINAIAQLITSEVNSMEQVLPLVTGSPAHSVTKVNAPLSADQLKARYDAIVSQPTSNAEVNEAFGRAVLK